MTQTHVERDIPLTPLELAQYSRHLKLPGFGMEKQERLRSARVLLIGAGGLGCPMGLYLAAAGVGTLGVVDFDRVERSNLQRQIAHSEANIGQLKVDSLIQTMRGINPLLHYVSHPARLDEGNVEALVRQYDLVLDGSDNFATRFLLADACYLNRVPLLQGSVYEYEAQMALFLPGQGACYRCVFQEPPQKNALAPCADVGVLGVVPGTMGLMMATEAVKYLTGLGESIQGQLLMYSALSQTLRKLRLSQNETCPLCGTNPSILKPVTLQTQCETADAATRFEMPVDQAKQLLEEGYQLLDVREPYEFQAGHLVSTLHIPLGQLTLTSVTEVLDPHQPVLVYCHKGQRSLEAVRILRGLGYESVYSLQGGILAWNASFPAEAVLVAL